jgi:hypothetical protein
MFGEGQLGLEIAEMLCNTEQSAVCFGELMSSLSLWWHHDRLCSLVVRVSATDTEVPGSIPGDTRFF